MGTRSLQESTLNKSSVRRYFHDFVDAQNVEVAYELLAADVVMFRPDQTIVGIDNVLLAAAAMFSNIRKITTEILQLIEEGDFVVAHVEHKAVFAEHSFGTPVGNVSVAEASEVTWSGIAIFELLDGRIVKEWVARDELGIVHQMGARIC